VQGMQRLKNRILLFVNDCFEDKHNAAIGVFLQALHTKSCNRFCVIVGNKLKKSDSKMMKENLLKQIEFIKEIDKIKYIQRRTKLFKSDRNENDAEHSWHLAMMAMVLSEHSDAKIDLLKVIKMVLIHDIVEIDTGDIFLYDLNKNHDNTEEELKAAKRIFGILPEKQAAEFIKIWIEFEDGITNEAKFAKSLDKLEPMLQNATNNGGTWKEFDVKYQTVYDKKKSIKNGSTKLWDYAENLIKESVEKGFLDE